MKNETILRPYKFRGYTLMEILLLILLIGIFSAGFLSFYTAFLRSEREVRFRIKNEKDIPAFTNYLRKELAGIGFGMDRSLATVDKITYCASDNSCLEFYSLNLRQDRWSGCWWVCSKNEEGSFQFMSTALSRLGAPCPDPLGITNSTDYYIVLDSSSKNLINPTSVTCNLAYQGTIWFYKGRKAYPDQFKGRLQLNPSSDRICSPQSQELSLRVGNDPSQPIVSCVRKVYFDFNATSKPPILKVCLLLQVGGRSSTPQGDTIDFPSLCGCTDCNVAFTSEDRYFRYRFVKELITLNNIW
ncbi:MAG: hypothetical protein ABWJ99_03050 [Caldimicrobium sp.]